MENLFKYYNHLGFFNPYYRLGDSKLNFDNSLKNILASKSNQIELDIAALVSLLSKGYIIGDGTIVKGINKSPWFTKYNEKESKWDYYKGVKFNNRILESWDISTQLFGLLKDELRNYIQDRKSIGLLLTGGMDSRMVAGTLDTMIKDGELNGVQVKAFTWGDADCRDVIYAKRIADRLNWSWKHFEITAQDFLNNIEAAAIRGCEYSPNHLHAMLKVREEKGIDCIIAASFGDSIGRGEYSGRTTLHLKDIRSNINNKYGFFKEGIVESCENSINESVHSYWNLFPQQHDFQQKEQDYQIHYMRRNLNPCLSVINEKITLFQAFSSPEVVKFMWSIDPGKRNNEVYKGLLKLFKTDLRDIPWARTGLVYDSTEGIPDSYKRTYDLDSYSKLFNLELFDTIKNLVLSDRMKKLNIFNFNSLNNTFKLMRSPMYKYDIKLEEKLTWLASLSLFLEEYKVEVIDPEVSKNGHKDLLNSYLIYKQTIRFQIRTLYRRIYLKKK